MRGPTTVREAVREAAHPVRPTLTWVPVRDETGRTHMEMRWILPKAESEKAHKSTHSAHAA